jgi:hypothetical protein
MNADKRGYAFLLSYQRSSAFIGHHWFFALSSDYLQRLRRNSVLH